MNARARDPRVDAPLGGPDLWRRIGGWGKPNLGNPNGGARPMEPNLGSPTGETQVGDPSQRRETNMGNSILYNPSCETHLPGPQFEEPGGPDLVSPTGGARLHEGV